MKKFLTSLCLAVMLVCTCFMVACGDNNDNNDKDNVVAVTGISVNYELKDGESVSVGNSYTYTATVTPANATDKTVTWISSDPTIATVVNGVVTGVAEGEVTITAKAGDKTDSFTVKVWVPVVIENKVGVGKNYTIASVDTEGTVVMIDRATPNGWYKITAVDASDAAIEGVEIVLQAGMETITGNPITFEKGVMTNSVTVKATGETAIANVTVKMEETTEPDDPGVDPVDYESVTVGEAFNVTLPEPASEYEIPHVTYKVNLTAGCYTVTLDDAKAQIGWDVTFGNELDNGEATGCEFATELDNTTYIEISEAGEFYVSVYSDGEVLISTYTPVKNKFENKTVGTAFTVELDENNIYDSASYVIYLDAGNYNATLNGKAVESYSGSFYDVIAFYSGINEYEEFTGRVSSETAYITINNPGYYIVSIIAGGEWVINEYTPSGDNYQVITVGTEFTAAVGDVVKVHLTAGNYTFGDRVYLGTSEDAIFGSSVGEDGNVVSLSAASYGFNFGDTIYYIIIAEEGDYYVQFIKDAGPNYTLVAYNG